MGDIGGDECRVKQRRAERRPKKSAGSSLVQKQKLHPLRRVLDVSGRFEGGNVNRLLRPILEGCRIEYKNVRPRSFIEALPAFLTDPATLDERPQNGGERDLSLI